MVHMAPLIPAQEQPDQVAQEPVFTDQVQTAMAGTSTLTTVGE